MKDEIKEKVLKEMNKKFHIKGTAIETTIDLTKSSLINQFKKFIPLIRYGIGRQRMLLSHNPIASYYTEKELEIIEQSLSEMEKAK